jgi:hypothetical protein
MTRSILAVLAGIATLTVLSFGIEAVAGGENKLLMSVYTLAAIAAGGCVTALVAARSPTRHAVIMGSLQALMTFAVMFEMRDRLPLWGWAAGILLTVPAAWLGAKLAEHHQIRRHR